jgi:thiosulfate dehydrogenase
VATSEQALPLEHFLAKTALRAKLRRELPHNVPIASDENGLMLGATVYRDSCALCHGLPSHPPAAVGIAMFPQAPQLLVDGSMVTDDPPGETFWKAKNGIRLSGMPRFSDTLTDRQLWQVSVMLAAADKLPPTVIQRLTTDDSPPRTAAPSNSAMSK